MCVIRTCVYTKMRERQERNEMKRRARRGAEQCVCARERRGREGKTKRDRSRGREKKRKGRGPREKERERERETKGRENAEEGERSRKECMGTRRKRADRDLPVPHSTNAKASSPALSAP